MIGIREIAMLRLADAGFHSVHVSVRRGPFGTAIRFTHPKPYFVVALVPKGTRAIHTIEAMIDDLKEEFSS